MPTRAAGWVNVYDIGHTHHERPGGAGPGRGLVGLAQVVRTPTPVTDAPQPFQPCHRPNQGAAQHYSCRKNNLRSRPVTYTLDLNTLNVRNEPGPPGRHCGRHAPRALLPRPGGRCGSKHGPSKTPSMRTDCSENANDMHYSKARPILPGNSQGLVSPAGPWHARMLTGRRGRRPASMTLSP